MIRFLLGSLFGFLAPALLWATPFDKGALFNLNRLYEPLPRGMVYEVSCFDREGRNLRDGFIDPYYLYVEKGEYVVLDEEGPGILINFWLPKDSAAFGTGTIHFLMDDDTVPRLSVESSTLFSGTLPFAPYPLALNEMAASGGNSLFAPMAYQKRIRVRFSKPPFFYHFLLRRFLSDSVTMPDFAGTENNNHLTDS